jgi:SOS-response transcriptional repressor LexA
VAIPVLSVVAATHGGKGDPFDALDQVHPESLLAAPSDWCPNPTHTRCLRVHVRSMMPLIHDGYIIVIDTSQTNHGKLYGHIVIAAHKDHGLIVSRLQRFDDTEVLVPENREYESTAVSTNGWRIVAKLLWWIGRAE